MKKGILFLIIYGMILSFAFSYREPLMIWLNESRLSHLPIMFILAILFGVIPIVPFSVFAGLMGAKYGVGIGSAINLIGSVGAAATFFIMARYFFVEKFQNYISKYKGIKKFDRIISQNAFIAVLFSRLIPVVPPPVVNIYSGLSTMLFKTYIIATTMGQIPGMIIYAYLGNQLFAATHSIFIGIFIYLAFLIVVLIVYRWWYKGKSKVILE
ncbi:VTT domain-containing protein [Bacillus sp. B15-48]|uniref:TVP38/TMEM64 family protein n=1 Tax=Bacillus sp. B15-48 TaxID=1548601 RepID=UPI00193F475E|nr:VTT domain-containing protein [Bacillus sp. B15-48]MBM4763459.1 TVP38/TMEM64 family protein [Bacillus sp. B15-48]